MKFQNLVCRTAILAVTAAALMATTVSASGDQFTLWGDTNNDQVLDTIIDTDPGLTQVFTFPIPSNTVFYDLKVHDAVTNKYTQVTGTVQNPTAAECIRGSGPGISCQRY